MKNVSAYLLTLWLGLYGPTAHGLGCREGLAARALAEGHLALIRGAIRVARLTGPESARPVLESNETWKTLGITAQLRDVHVTDHELRALSPGDLAVRRHDELRWGKRLAMLQRYSLTEAGRRMPTGRELELHHFILLLEEHGHAVQFLREDAGESPFISRWLSDPITLFRYRQRYLPQATEVDDRETDIWAFLYEEWGELPTWLEEFEIQKGRANPAYAGRAAVIEHFADRD